MRIKNKQFKVYWILMFVCAVAAAITVLSPLPASMVNIPTSEIPKLMIVVANFGLIFVGYGLLGLLGIYLAKKNSWPGVYKEGAGLKNLFFRPMILGAISGLFIIVGSIFFGLFHNLGELPHPQFPYSISASFSAGIGEELLMRLFLVSFWAWLLNLIFRKFSKRNITDWAAVMIAAVLFGLSHMVGPLYASGSFSQIPVIFIIEMLVLNGFVGIFAGRQMIKYGFVAAIGVHFWADIVWHVIYGAF